uniref:Uncharacterized protein n=1 Tax=viral metagenome TaxID=1070528 RepID=A0A6C0APV0_9ZZZZ
MSAAAGSSGQSMDKIKARREANLARGKTQFEQLRLAIKDAPIFLCSTHGLYDRTIEPVKWTVPPNTFIFEAQTIGDLTLTSLDIPLWELLQGGRRWGFMKYLMRDYASIERKGIQIDEVYKQTFASLVLYKPGDEIYERVLNIGGGRSSKTTGAREQYAGMGFFRFNAGDPAYTYRGYGRREYGSPNPYEILHKLQEQMVGDDYLELTDNSFVHYVNLLNQAPTWRNGTPIQDVDFRLAWKHSDEPGQPGKPKIFIFSSCAAVNDDSSPEGIRRWEMIARIQQQRMLEAKSDLNIYSLLGGSYGSAVENANVKPGKLEPGGGTTMVLRPRPYEPAIFAPGPRAGAIEFFSEPDSDLKEEKLYTEGEKGGYRPHRVTRKYKAKTKTKAKAKATRRTR